MDFLQDIKDSVETSVNIKLFSSEKQSSYSHIFHSSYEKFPLTQIKTLDNFNASRLSSDPYPEDDRPRSKKDLESVLYHR